LFDKYLELQHVENMIYAIKSYHGRYVRVLGEEKGFELLGDLDYITDSCKFEISNHTGGKIALRSCGTRQKYVTVDKHGKLLCTKDKPEDHELFTCALAPRKKPVSFFNIAKQKFMCTDSNRFVYADNEVGHDDEVSTFMIESSTVCPGMFNLKMATLDLYVCADKQKHKSDKNKVDLYFALVADRPVAKEWECFSIEIHANAMIAIRTWHPQNKYFTAMVQGTTMNANHTKAQQQVVGEDSLSEYQLFHLYH